MTSRKRGLGRGLNALFEDEEPNFSGETNDMPIVSTAAQAQSDSMIGDRSRVNMGVDQLEPSRFQPRKIFDNDALDELAESIKTHGLLQPIVVRLNPDGSGKYEIIAGERRWRASQRAQMHEVPVIIKEMSDLEALEIALIENLQREDLNPVDEAMGYKKLLDEHEYTQEQLATQLGKSRSYIANMTRLLALHNVVLAHLERGDISTGHARALITSDNAGEVVRKIIKNGLSVRDTERLVSSGLSGTKAGKTKVTAGTLPSQMPGFTGDSSGFDTTANTYTKDVDTIALEKDISNQLGMNFVIDSRDGKSGKVQVEFKSLDQLDELIKRLSV